MLMLGWQEVDLHYSPTLSDAERQRMTSVSRVTGALRVPCSKIAYKRNTPSPASPEKSAFGNLQLHGAWNG